VPGDQTQTDLALMEQTANQFETVAAALQTMLQTVRQKVVSLQAAWVGRGASSFQQVMDEWTRDQDSINRLLGQTAELIRSSGQEYSTTDTDAASRFRSGGGTAGPAPAGS
jgi:WXG100 family type VII secretion target